MKAGTRYWSPKRKRPGWWMGMCSSKLIAGTEVVVLWEHKFLRASGEFGESALVSPARALPLRAPIRRFGLPLGVLFHSSLWPSWARRWLMVYWRITVGSSLVVMC